MHFLVKILVVLVLIGTSFAARIVVLYPFGTKSHFLSIKPAIEALAERHHQITVFTPYRQITNGIKNVKEIDLPQVSKATDEFKVDWFALQQQGSLQFLFMLKDMMSVVETSARELFANSEFRRIISERDADLFLIDAFSNDFVFPVVDLTGIPFVTYCPASPVPMLLDAVGGTREYASVPSSFTDFTDDMTFFERIVNAVASESSSFFRRYFMLPQLDAIVQQQFPGAKLIRDVEGKASISIVNNHPTTTFPRALPPSVVSIGALHTRPPKELPPTLKQFVDEAKEGFITFSLGSLVPVSSMPNKTAELFMRVFSQLPLRVIWKWEAALPDKVPPNVLMTDWIPQQDLLGHPNSKLFITHGGLLGTQEAIYHGVPLLSLPFGNDQKANIVKAQRDGYAIQLDWGKLEESEMLNAINYLVYNEKARESIAKASKLLHDEPIPDKELAVYWVEYVIRHGTTEHLQLASKSMPFYKLYLLDVLAFLIIALELFVYLAYRLLKFELRMAKNWLFKPKKTLKTN